MLLELALEQPFQGWIGMKRCMNIFIDEHVRVPVPVTRKAADGRGGASHQTVFQAFPSIRVTERRTAGPKMTLPITMEVGTVGVAW